MQANAFAQCQSSGHAHSDVRAPTVGVFREQDEEEKKTKNRAPPRDASREASRKSNFQKQFKKKSIFGDIRGFWLSAKQETLLCTLLVTRRGAAAAARAAGSTRAGPQCQAQTVA